MAVMIVSILVVTVVFILGTFVWWAMMNDWIKKDRQQRGVHHAERSSRNPRKASEGPRVVRMPPANDSVP